MDGLWFNSDKCAVNQKQFPFFGALFDENGLHPDTNRVEKIKSLSTQKDLTELQRILRIITYMKPFIPRLSDSTAPIRELVKKKVEFKPKITNISQKCEEMMLTYSDLTKNQPYSLGVALTQNDKPIAFVSKAFTEME